MAEDRTPLTDSRVVGTWNGTNCPATLTINADHSARVTGFPVDTDGSKVTRSVAGDGSWKIDPAVVPQRLSLTIGSAGHEVGSGKDGSTTVLYVTVGDPDDGVACRYLRSTSK
ncbi:hypothetical protein [Streptomyces sp. NPDC029721]|uniref:hypothetical protein n=1 Tax=Streptomyces sp. NPDC029721 TaxID=3157090 RepID=UPI0033DB1A98